MFFDRSTGSLSGATITTYLLEKSRVVGCPSGERSYHFFYMLLGALDRLQSAETTSADVDGKDSFSWNFGQGDLGLIDDPMAYSYTRPEGSSSRDDVTLPGVTEEEKAQETFKTLLLLGVERDSICSLIQLVAAILHLSHIVFVSEDADSEGENAKIDRSGDSGKALSFAASLLGCSGEELELVLCTMQRAGIRTKQNTVQAAASRDGLAKLLYTKLFDWVIRRSNESLSHEGMEDEGESPRSGPLHGAQSHGKKGFHISVLDIFGFESFVSICLHMIVFNFVVYLFVYL